MKACSVNLRTGLTGLKKDEIDRLENYVLANGINSRRRWEEPWMNRKNRSKEKILPPLLAFVDQVRERTGRCVRKQKHFMI